MTQVLVVDDSLSVRKALETILRPLAYNVRMADSGEAALGALAAERADLVIADVLMPGISGFELCERLRASAEHAQTPVVLISGIVSAEELGRARAAGALGLVKKPFRADELLPLVQSALNTQRGETDLPQAAVAAPPPAVPLLDELLGSLLDKQGVLGALVLNAQGAVPARGGDALPDEETLRHYLRFFMGAAGVFGVHLGDEWHSLLLEFGGRALLLSPLPGGHALVVVLRDAGAATVAKFVLRGQRAQFGAALHLN